MLLLFYPHFLRFRATFPCYWHSILASQAGEGLHQLWALPWLPSTALLFPGFSVTVLPRELRFWALCPLHSFPAFFDTFCDSDAGRNTPSRIFVCICPHRVVPSGKRMALNYSYCSYKAIDLSIVPESHDRVKVKLLHMFCFFKVYGKTIKTFWARVDKKYCL